MLVVMTTDLYRILHTPCVFLKRSVAKGNAYYSLAESVRVDGKVMTRIIKQLGRLSDEEANKWNLLLRTEPHDVSRWILDTSVITTLHSYRHGTVALAHAMWKRLGMDAVVYDALSHVKGRSVSSKLIETMVVNRIDDPCSKLAMLDWMPGTSLPFILGIDPTHLHANRFYRAMDALWMRRGTIERKLFDSVVSRYSGGGIVLKDLTSTYFEGMHCPMARHGHSRDHRPDRLQVSWSLVETEEGLPVTFEIYPGNTHDSKTLQASIGRIQRLFGLKSGIFVSDRGISTEENIDTVTSAGFHYVVAETLSNITEIVDTAIAGGLRPVDGGGDLTYADVFGEDRYIVIHGGQKEIDDMAALNRALAKGERIVAAVNDYASKHPNAGSTRMLSRAVRETEKHHLSTYFDVEWNAAGKNITARQKEKVGRERRYAGYWILRTDLKDKTAAEIISIYKGLWRVERTFREIKSSLDVRPVRHRRSDRVAAHIWMCVLAYLIERIAGIDVKRMQERNSPDRQLPTVTAGTVFGAFGSIVLNEHAVKGNSKHRWFTATELTGWHSALAEALGIGEEMFTAEKTVQFS